MFVMAKGIVIYENPTSDTVRPLWRDLALYDNIHFKPIRAGRVLEKPDVTQGRDAKDLQGLDYNVVAHSYSQVFHFRISPSLLTKTQRKLPRSTIMFRNPLKRPWNSFTPFSRGSTRFNGFVRPYSSKPPSASRIDRITARLPRRLQKYTAGLRSAPVSHVVSFLILHEITAIVPIFALFGVFHYTNYVPVSWMTQHFGGYVQSGVARFERYFAKKGWFGFTLEDLASDAGSGNRQGSSEQTSEAVDRFEKGEQKYKVLVGIALAYAVTKVLLPVRIMASVWATPWFAGVMLRARGLFSRKT